LQLEINDLRKSEGPEIITECQTLFWQTSGNAATFEVLTAVKVGVSVT